MKRRGVVPTIVLSLLLAAVPAAGQPAQQVPLEELPGASAGLIAYALAEYEVSPSGCGYATRPRGVAVRDVDGGPERVLSQTSGGINDNFEGDPAWSPDGAALAFTSQLGAESATVKIVSPSVASPVQVAQGRNGRFSPDGRRLAFVRLVEPAAGLVVVGLQESMTAGAPLPSVDVDQVLAETSTPPASPLVSIPFDGYVSAPTWSPDGARLAFVLGSPGGWPRGDLWSVAADGTDLQRLTEGLAVDGGTPPRWSPDGRHLAFEVAEAVPDEGTFFVLHVLDLEDGSLTRIERRQDGWSWHPAGDRLALNTFEGLQIIGPEGDQLGLVRHGMDPVFGAPAWTADGRRLLQLIRNGCELPKLWAFDAATGAGAKVSDDATVSGNSATAASPGVTDRVSGADRIATAVELSVNTFESVTAVVLARADVYADALVAGPLAGALGAPLLLTGSESLHPAVAAEIVRLGAREAVLVGGEQALSPRVVADLVELGVAVRRVSGEDRFALAAAVADELDADAAYLVEGANADPQRGWPDAVSVSALAAAQGRPVLLTYTNELPQATRDAIGGIDEVVIVGGPAAVGDDIEDEVGRLVDQVDRVAGGTRYDTSARLAARAADAGLDEDGMLLVTGLNWPDSLAAGPAAAATGVGVLLLDGQRLEASPPSIAFLQGRDDADGRLRVVGGLSAIRQPVAVDVERAATDR